MHQLFSLRHAPHFSSTGGRPALKFVPFVTQPSLRFRPTCLPWPGRRLAGELSLDFRSSCLATGLALGSAFASEGGGWKRKPKHFGIVQCVDDERVWAFTENEFVEEKTSAGAINDAWESDFNDEDVRVLAKFKSVYNFVQVLEISRRADHELAGCKLLLLDRAGNIQSVYHPYKLITSSYYDIFATLPPLLPEGPVGILGLGAGTAARIIQHFWPHIDLHGWELDPAVVMVGRQFFDLTELEGKLPVRRRSAFELEEDPSQLGEGEAVITGIRKTNSNDIGRLVVHIGDALSCKLPTEEGFAGLIVDMFSDGAVIPALQQPQTWQHLRKQLKPGGRIMVNCGGSCVEAVGKHAKDGNTIMEETIQALAQIFPDEVFRFDYPGKANNSVALTGPSPDLQAWEQALPESLRGTVYGWLPVY